MYWLVSLPLLEGRERTWNILQQKTTYDNELSTNFHFEIPELRVGTLDSLLTLSDDLVKVNSMMEAVVNKIRRQLFDMQTTGGSEDREEVLVEGNQPDNYIERFSWDEAKYPARQPLNETVKTMSETIGKLEDDLKVRLSEYNQLKGALSAAARKQTGSLAVRDLAGIVKDEFWVSTENLTTLYVVASKFQRAEWFKSYEKLTDFVVPRSSVQVYEDNDSVLFNVVLFKRIADTFKSEARKAGFQVRDFDLEAAQKQVQAGAGDALRSAAEQKRALLEQWCLTAYGEAFSAWIHVCAIRLFVESILRYGLPPAFLGVLMKPIAKSVPKLRKVMSEAFGTRGTTQYFNDGEPASGAAAGAAGGDGEMFPYVSFTINIDG